MSTETIVRHCAPTLAGLKVGSLFSCRYDNAAELVRFVQQQNQILNQKGVYFVLIKMHGGLALIYVYRQKKLQRILANPEVQDFLRSFGYTEFTVPACLLILRKRLMHQDFPHDIGVFLGYPLDDIKAFITNKGANCKCIGCWKAYTNLDAAEKTFAMFKKCTRIYCQRYFEGIDITRLTVAG